MLSHLDLDQMTLVDQDDIILDHLAVAIGVVLMVDGTADDELLLGLHLLGLLGLLGCSLVLAALHSPFRSGCIAQRFIDTLPSEIINIFPAIFRVTRLCPSAQVCFVVCVRSVCN